MPPLNRIQAAVCWVTLFVATAPAAATGFWPGHLVATDSSRIYLIDPATGTAQIIVGGQSNLGDIVYNPVSDSLFVTSGGIGGSTIWEVSWDAATGYQMSSFLEGLDSVTTLAVDRAGWLYFNQEDFVNDRIWRADPLGNVSAVTGSPFGFLFTPQFMNLSADDSTLFITTSPSNNVEVASLSSGQLSLLTEAVSFPSGIDVAADGSAYVAHGFSNNLISVVSPGGSVQTYLDSSWMSGAAGDIEYDDATGNLYVLDRDLWVIDSNRNASVLFDGNFFVYSGLDIISAVPEPSAFALMGAGILILSARRRAGIRGTFG